jgi:hypothetical protein
LICGFFALLVGRRTLRGMFRALRLVPALASLSVLGCGEPAVGVRLVFPSEEAFLQTAVARIDVYDGTGSGAKGPDAICRSLSVNPPAPPAGVKPIATSGLSDVCDFRAGGAPIPGVGIGRRVVFVEALDFSSQAIVRGCSVVDVNGVVDAPADDAAAFDVVDFVTIQLATLPEFPSVAPTCASVEEKCEERISCKP